MWAAAWVAEWSLNLAAAKPFGPCKLKRACISAPCTATAMLQASSWSRTAQLGASASVDAMSVDGIRLRSVLALSPCTAKMRQLIVCAPVDIDVACLTARAQPLASLATADRGRLLAIAASDQDTSLTVCYWHALEVCQCSVHGNTCLSQLKVNNPAEGEGVHSGDEGVELT